MLVLASLSCYRSQVRAGVRWDMANSGGEDLRSQEGENFLYFAYGSNLLTERIHLRNPSAVFCSVARLQVSALLPAPAMASAPLCRRGSQDFENSLSLRRLLAALGRECSSFCSKYIRVPCTTPGRSLSPSALCLTPAELCYSGTCASQSTLRSLS